MNIPLQSSAKTANETQRLEFVESLYKSLRKEAEVVQEAQQRYASLAREYLGDGLEESECVELLVIDGLNRESAQNYLSLVQSETKEDLSHKEYSFRFEDEFGKIWSSFEVGMIIYASNESDAWVKAEEAIEGNISLEADRILSVTPVG